MKYKNKINEEYSSLCDYEGYPVGEDVVFGFNFPNTEDLDGHIDNVNQILQQQYGKEYEVSGWWEDERNNFHIYTNLPFEDYMEHTFGPELPEELIDYDGWLNEYVIVDLWKEVGEEYPNQNSDYFKNSFGLDKEEVRNFFSDFREYTLELMDKYPSSQKYGLKKDLDDFNTKENLLDFYEICRSNKKDCPFTRTRINSFSEN